MRTWFQPDLRLQRRGMEAATSRGFLKVASEEAVTRGDVLHVDFGVKVFVMLEDPAYLTDQGWRFFRPRQEQFYLIH